MLCAVNALNVTWHLVINQAWVEKGMVMCVSVRGPMPGWDKDPPMHSANYVSISSVCR